MKHAFLATRLVALCLAATALVSTPGFAADDEAGYKTIFNGKDLEGWDGNPKFWSVKDGAITGTTTSDNPTSGNTFLIYRPNPVDDFVLKLEYKIVGGNSGIQYRSKEAEKWGVGGYQADFEAGDGYSGILYEERGRGILATRGRKVTIDEAGKKVEQQVGDAKEIGAKIKKEDWNTYEVSAQGNHLIHKINGNVTAEVIDSQKDKSAASGVLALQLHAGPPMVVQFKNIRIKQGKTEEPKK